MAQRNNRLFWILVISFILTVIFPHWISAELATPGEAQQVCLNWLNFTVFHDGDWNGTADPVIADVQDVTVNDTLVARYFAIAPSGYVLVPVLKDLPPIKATSDQYGLDFTEPDGPTVLFKEILMHRIRLFADRYGSLEAVQPEKGPRLLGAEHRQQWQRFLQSEKDFLNSLSGAQKDTRIEFGPHLTTSWHQSDPYYDYCPYGDGGRCVVGCVATAAAQILAFHKWPPRGTGSYAYYWNGDNSCGGSTPGATLEADYSDPYDWDNIPDNCNFDCTPEEEAALAELNYEVGVAFNMDYGRCGSGAYTASAMDVFPNYFRFHDWIEKHDRSSYSPLAWSDLIRFEMETGRPAQYRISRHSIVCDGWRDIDYYTQVHMNYGWGGGHNFWYTVDNLHCDWEGCTPMVEYILTNMVPDNGVYFTSDTTWGYSPLEVEFLPTCTLQVDSWTWDFGDGDSAFVESPKHTYVAPGQYNVMVAVDAGGDISEYATVNYITVLADTVIGTKAQGTPGSTVAYEIHLTNTVPVRRIQVPVEFSGTLGLALDSFTTAGCRTEYFDQDKWIHFDPANKRSTFNIFNTEGSSPDLDPGTGPVLKIFFTIPAGATPDQTAEISLDAYSTYDILIAGPVLDFEPSHVNGSIMLEFVCGDASYDGIVNLLDITYLINYLYRGGPEPIPYNSGNVNDDATINILDVTYLINYLYRSGAAPNCP